jgi:hypothetical protein
MTLNQYIAQEHVKRKNAYEPIKPIECVDGFTISVQASRVHYCEPREKDGPYLSVECGFPSSDVPEMADYKDGDDYDTDSVFVCVPVEIVEAVLAKHGGMK